ncbi:hypothetical protein MKX01_031892 [Papaver californicum]|nr:hypothetical protein MKX01_031892 [Papaver californicum]
MPSVGMRRSTRIFVPKSVKDAEGATVLRSGKRLSSPLFVDSKAARGNENEWFPPSMVEKSCGVVVPSFYNKSLFKRNEFVAKQIKKKSSSLSKKLDATVTVIDGPKNKMYGNGYGRKRLRSVAVVGALTESNKKLDFDFEKRGLEEERKYGIHFVRKHPRKAISSESSASLAIEHSNGNNEFSKMSSKSEDLAGNSDSLISESRESLNVIVESSPCCSIQFSIFLVSLSNNMRRVRVSMSKLVDFMCSEPIGETFSRHGIHFFPDLSCRRSSTFVSRICRVWGAQDFVPMFSLNFNSAPFTFISLHFRMLLRSQSLMEVLERYPLVLVMKPHEANSSRKRLSSEMGVSLGKTVASVSSSAKRRKGVNFVDRAVPLARRRISIRRRPNSRRVKTFRSLRFKRPPTLVSQKSDDEVSDMFDTGVDGTTSSINKVKKPLSSGPCSTDIIKETNQKRDTICCSANVLVTESDKCYRAEGANIVLEYSESDDWLLVVKVQGLTRFIHKAVDLMRPLCTTNRFTHDLIWIGRTDWRLEFSDRQDWSIFKELHSECADRNMKAMAAREVVPVPGVYEVENHGDYKKFPYVRPNAYIKMHVNEVERLLSRTANYDVDSDDEEWLGKLNNDLCGDGGPLRPVSAENFEKMVDIFEKAAYCKPDDVSDESKAIRLCSDTKMNIFTAVYHYWVEKRKRKNSALLRVLQCAPPRKQEMLQKPFLRKKRSFKRQASKCGNGKPRTFFQVFAEEQEQDANRRVDQAKLSAKVSVELAVVKRRRAQELMEIADLATYKATLALKIVEAVQHEIPSDDFVTFILS